MISLEQVKLLESKVSRMIEYIKRITEENMKLKEKLESYEKRTGELEVLFQRFKEDQNRIEDGILSALDLLNQFEDAVESKLSGKTRQPSKPAQEPKVEPQPETAKVSEQAPEKIPLEEAPSEETPKEEKNSGPALSGAELDIF